MRQFIMTSVPTDKYQEVKRVGDCYVCHFDPVADLETGTTLCYECIVAEEPDMATLRQELQEWKAYLAGKELEIAKKEKTKEIEAYDISDAVNSFTITHDGQKVTDYWLPRDLRTSLEGDVLAAQSLGDTYKFDIREMGISLTLNCTKFLAALAVLRQYAYTAYNRTSEHLAHVQGLTTIQEVEAYDYTTGYPERLTFEINDLT